MNSDDVRKTGSHWTISAPGTGHTLRFLCPRCNKASQQLGSKLRHFKGLRQRVCAPCHAILSAPKVPT